jgi:hypothetical protein
MEEVQLNSLLQAPLLITEALLQMAVADQGKGDQAGQEEVCGLPLRL